MGALKDLILGHRSTSKYLISIEDYLQTFNEFKEVQNSLNLAQGIERLPMHRSRGNFSIINIGYKLNKNQLFSPNEDRCKTLDFWLLPVIFIPKLSTSHHSVDVLKSRVATPKNPHNSAVAAERNG